MHRWFFVLATLVLLVGGCKGASSGGEKKLDLDSDPLALLPPAAVVVASLDARSLLDEPALGARVASLADALVPLGPDAGFEAERDVDRVVVASYATTSVDAVALVSGRFDPARIAAAGKTKRGAPVTHAPYAGWTTYSAAGATWVPLTSRTLVAGTSDAVRRVLDKLKKGKPERELPPWAATTLATPGAGVAVAADFATQPAVAAALGPVPLPWIQGVRVVRVVGDFQKPGMNVVATVTYGDAQQAASAADGIRTASRWVKVMGPMLGGISLHDLQVEADAADVQCKFALDDRTLTALLDLAPRLLPSAR